MSTKRNIGDYFTPEQIEKRNRQTRNQKKRVSSPDQGLINALGYDYDSFYDDTAALNKAVVNMKSVQDDRLKLEREMLQSTKGGAKPVSYDDTAALNKAVIAMQLREDDRLKLEREMMSVPLTSPIFNQTLYPNPVYKDPLDYSGSPPAFDGEPAHGGFIKSFAGSPLAFDGEPAHGGFIPYGSSREPAAEPVVSASAGMPEQPALTLAQRGVNPNAVYPLRSGTVVDQNGSPVRSGNRSVVGLPTQNPAYQAPAGGKGANATPQSAIDQLTGIKGFGGK